MYVEGLGGVEILLERILLVAALGEFGLLASKIGIGEHSNFTRIAFIRVAMFLRQRFLLCAPGFVIARARHSSTTLGIVATPNTFAHGFNLPFASITHSGREILNGSVLRGKRGQLEILGAVLSLLAYKATLRETISVYRNEISFNNLFHIINYLTFLVFEMKN